MPATTFPAIPAMFFVAAGLAGLLLSSGFLLLIFGPTSYAQIQELSRHVYHEGGYHQLPLAVTPASYHLLRYGLAVIALSSFGGLAALGAMRDTLLRQEVRRLNHEIRWTGKVLAASWQQLPRPKQLVASGLLLLILAVRLWYLSAYVLSTDEVASYDYFVRPGLLTLSSFYPIPNNHLLFNLTCWPLTFCFNNPRLVMRLPTFVAATAGTGLGYLLLLRWSGFRVATLATGAFSLLPFSLYYAAAGRGYFLQFTLMLLAFFAVLAVLRGRTYHRLSWVVFLVVSVLGFYTIPTFLYPFVSLSLGLLLGLGWQRRWLELGHLALASSIVAVVTGLLYWPVICVSGWRQLVDNRYVAALTDTVFWPQYWRQLRILAELIAGNYRVGTVAGSGLLVLGPAACWLLPRSTRSLGALAWLVFALPLPLMAVQQVQVPARALLYTSFFACILGSLMVTALLDRLRMAPGLQTGLSLAVIVAYGGYQFWQQLGPYQDEVQVHQQMRAAYAWLARQGNPRVLLAAADYELYFQHYARQYAQPPRLHTNPLKGLLYDYTIQGYRAAPLPAWALPPYYTPVYRNNSIVIYVREKH